MSTHAVATQTKVAKLPEKIGTTFVVVAPFVAVGIAILWLAYGVISGQVSLWGLLFDLTFGALYYVATAIGITVGYHRMLTHNSFQTNQGLKDLLVLLGITGLQGSHFMWVAEHRKHHQHTDEEGDPHSPHTDGGGFRGFLHAHTFWLFVFRKESKSPHIKDLIADPHMRWLHTFYVPLVLLTVFAFPFAVGALVKGSLIGGVETMIWAGLVRGFLVQHVTWSINSVCHITGERPFGVTPLTGQSTNCPWRWLRILSLGESHHHNHHRFPRSAVHGLMSEQELKGDLAGRFILFLHRMGWAKDPYKISEESIKKALAESPTHEPAIS